MKQMTGTGRQVKYEWLRITAMGMIITLHYFLKGGIAHLFSQDQSWTNLVYWLICDLCICAVNTYVLISGYFLTEAEFKPRRLLGLFIQVLEYSLLISIVMIATGQVDFKSLSVYDLIGMLLPIGTGEYWFITAYFFMYLLSPALGRGLRAMEKKAHRRVLVILVIMLCLEKTVVPMWLATDKYGYDLLWFLVLYVTAAYIRLYGIVWMEENHFRAWLVYLLSVAVILFTAVCCGVLGSESGSSVLLHYEDITTHYNFIAVYTASIGLFYIFRNASFHDEGVGATIAGWIGRLTLGVYLLHEHPLVCDRWQAWLGVQPGQSFGMVMLGWVVSLVVVYGAGLLIEYIRSLIHSYLARGRN